MIDKNIFCYHLPQEQIAKQPASPRDFSRLFIYYTKTDEIIFDHFYNLDTYIPKDSVMVFNKTKVLPARIVMCKVSGSKVKALFLVNEIANSQSPIINANTIRVFVDRKVRVGERLFFNKQYYVTVIAQQEHIFTVQFDFSLEKLFSLLEAKGTMPIPLYIKNSPLSPSQLKQKYQTIFAQTKGSAAAPTASLHFTNRLFQKLDEKGVRRLFTTLHVGMGTFAPVTKDQFQNKKLHEEWYEVPRDVFQLIHVSKQEGKKIVAIGTTVVRTLESIRNAKLHGKTDLFIYPPYQFQTIDSMVTNFHLPGSSLMMLVEAFLQYKNAKRQLVDLYKIAIEKKFRFYSFGDGMLIL